MNPILFEELVDKSGYLRSIEQLEAANAKFADAAVIQNERIRKSQAELIAELTKQRDIVVQLNNVQRGAGSELSGLKDDVTGLTTAYRQSNEQLKRNEQFLQNNSQVVDQMQKRLATLSAEYAKLDLSQKADLKRKKEIERELTQTTRAYNSLIRVTNTASKATDTAERSYDRLSKQTNQLRAQLRAMPGAFDAETGAINRNNRAAVELQKQIEKNSKALLAADRAMGTSTRNVGNYGSVVKDVAGQLVGFSSAAGAVVLVLRGIQAGLGIVQDMERLNAGLRASSRDSADFARSQQFLLGLADKLGVEYDTLVGTYKSLKAATKDTNMEGKATENVFRAVVTAGAKLGLTNEEVEGTLRALEQMISKGKVSAEELRGQLGERLPGALRLMSEALGVSTSKLDDMMKNGELIATEVLPKFAAQLGKTYSLENNQRIETMAANTARVKNETVLLVDQINNSTGVNKFFSALSGGFAGALRNLRLFVRDGSWTEFITFFGPNSLSARTARSIAKDDAVAKFSQMDPKQRAAELKRLRALEDQQTKAGSDDRYQTREIRRKLQDEELKMTVAGIQEKRRNELIAEKDAVEKNEKDLTRFQKQAVRKRTAELIALEKQLAGDPQNEVLAEKLKVYTRLDKEQKTKDKEVADRLKLDKPAKDDLSVLEQLDKQIKSIEETLQKQAMQDLKAGRLIDVDPKLTAKVTELKKQYEAIKAMQEAIEKGTYNTKVTYDAQPLASIDDATAYTGTRVGRNKSAELSPEQIKAKAAKTLAAQTDTLQKQMYIIQEYAGKREKLEFDLAGDLYSVRESDKNQLRSLLEEQQEAERAGQKERVQLIEEEIRRKKELYKEDMQARREVVEKSIEIGTTLVNGLFEIEQQKNQNRIADLEKQKEYELSVAGDNAGAKEAIERKYDEKRKAIQRKQDVQARAQALFNVALSTIQGVAKAYAMGPVGIPLAVAMGVLGAVQAGLILAKPMPAYKDGRGAGDTYEGPALAGEAGKELLVRDNKASLIDKPSIVDVKKGDIIYPNHITERLLRGEYREGSQIMERNRVAGQTATQLSQGRDQYQAYLMSKAFGYGGPSASAIGKAVGDAIAKHPKFHLSFDKNGFNVSQHDANTRIIQQRNKHQLGK
ncbi:tape measure protein [Spirosoma sordidisoli]|nr:tape measure protein [Spirosoma sordidisoli]